MLWGTTYLGWGNVVMMISYYLLLICSGGYTDSGDEENHQKIPGFNTDQ